MSGTYEYPAEVVLARAEETRQLVAELDRHRAFVQSVVEKSDRGICPVCSYLWSECECGVNAAEYDLTSGIWGGENP